MQSNRRIDDDASEEAFKAYFDCLTACLPVLAAGLFRYGRLIEAGPGCDRHLERLQQAALASSDDTAADCLSAVVIAEDDLVAVVLLNHAATSAEKTTFANMTRLLCVGLIKAREAARSQKSQAYFREALESLPEAIAIFDEDERFVFWNSKFTETYGFGVEMSVGRKFEDHLKACLDVGAVKNAVGRESAWLAERLQRFRVGEGAHEHSLSSGRWVRTQDRLLPGGGHIGIRTDITDYILREQSFRLLFDANPIPMLIIDQESLEIMAVNDASTAFYGYSQPQMTAMRLPDIRPEKTEGEIRAMIDRLDVAEVAQKPRIHVCANGEQRVVRVNTRFIEHKGHPAILAAVFDMTDRFRAEEELLRTRRFLRDVVDHVPVALFVKDMADDGRYVLYNRAGESLFGMSQTSVIGSRDVDLMAEDIVAEYQMQDNQVLRQGMLDLIEERAASVVDSSKLKSIRLRKVALNDSSSGSPRYVLGLAEDVTEQRNREAEISRLALHDQLTGLPNRRLFDERLAAGLDALQPGYMQAVFFLDLDGFKAVNDSFGHPAGDRLLQMVAERLEAILRPQDTVARFGGDEFAVTAAVLRPHEAERIATRIIASLSQPYEHQGNSLHVSASIGIAFTTKRTCTLQSLIAEADAALYHAKRSGKNRFSIWSRDAEFQARAGLPNEHESGAVSRLRG